MKILSINKEHTESFSKVAFNVDCLPSRDVITKSNEKLSESRDALRLCKIDADNKCFYIESTTTLSRSMIDSIVTIVIGLKDEIEKNIVNKNKARETMFKELEKSLELPVKYSFSSH